MNINQALKIKSEAFEYPRQGESWPCNDIEEEAQQVLFGRNEYGQTPEEEAEADAFLNEQSKVFDQQKQAKNEARKKLLEKAKSNVKNLNSSGVAEFCKASKDGFNREEIISAGFSEIAILTALRNKLVIENRKNYILVK